MDSKIKFCFILVLFLTSCSGNKIKKHLGSSDINLGDSTIVNLISVMNQSFDWYAITGGFVLRSELSEQLGVEYKGRTPNDNQKMVVFVKDNTVIYRELFSTHLIGSFPNIEVFEKIDSPVVLFKKVGPKQYDWYKIDKK